ncbi:MAG: hypothetical protein IPN20_23255 [Haliscomenobacter sp.]|nr:hypothetical protein [Haliscomenobacter sp.]
MGLFAMAQEFSSNQTIPVQIQLAYFVPECQVRFMASPEFPLAQVNPELLAYFAPESVAQYGPEYSLVSPVLKRLWE